MTTAFASEAFAPGIFDDLRAPVWVDLGAVPGPSGYVDPDGIAQGIGQLCLYNNKVFIGYGNWQTNPPPGASVVYWDLFSQTFVTLASTIGVDAFDTLNVIGADLWLPVTDPSSGADPDAYVVHSDDSLTVITGGQGTPYPWHLFQAFEAGGKVHLCGADRETNDYACIWRMENPANVKSWVKVFLSSSNERVSALFIQGGMLVAIMETGRVYTSVIPASTGSWTFVASVGQLFSAHNVTPVPGGVLLQSGYRYPLSHYLGSSARLLWWDGLTTQTRTVLPVIRDFRPGDDGKLYAIDGTTIYRMSADGLTPTPIGSVPNGNAASIAVSQSGEIYIGTTDSHLFVYR